jgi:glycosyltransferase involved in cell wall biosynthesis
MNKLYGNRPRPFTFERKIIHQTYYQEKRSNKFPNIITAYDLTHEKFPQYFPNQEKFLAQKRQALTSADLILSISENTKKDLINFYNIASEKIIVTHLADSLWTKGLKIETNLKLPENYVLFVGNREGYKNYFNTIEILADTLKKNQITFLCAGGPKFSDKENEQIKKLGLIDLVKHYPFRTDDELRTFYKNAMFFIFPSLYEGFGIPVLESMGCGTPVLLTRGSSFSEVGGEAGVYYDHLDANDLMIQFNKLLSPDNLKEVKARSLLNYNRFSWGKCFSETKLAYLKLI